MTSGRHNTLVPTRREIALILVLTVLFTLYLQFETRDDRTSWITKVGQPPKEDLISKPKTPPNPLTAASPKPKDPSPNETVSGVQKKLDWTRLVWGTQAVPQTTMVAHAPGWTLFDRLYVMNGTVYIVTNDPKAIPELRMITSSGYRVENPPEEVLKREPTAKDMQVISVEKAAQLFGHYADRIDGVTFIANEPVQFVAHYYHFSAELLFGLWRTYSSQDRSITKSGKTQLPHPRRLVFSHVETEKWRDYANINQYVLYSAFPSIGLEFAKDWQDRANLQRAFVFDRVVFGDRAAAMRGTVFPKTGRIASEPFALPGSPHWWVPIRQSVATAAGSVPTKGPPVITYISRQGWGRRMLRQADHEKLVAALHRLRDQYGYEVNIVSLDKMSHNDQIKLSARTTVMLGLHGNGLTSLIWMEPNPRSTVIEIFYPGGFAHDYEYISRTLGMSYFGIWNDKSFTNPDIPPVAYPDGFQGNDIPVNGDAVAALVHRQLSSEAEMDD